MSTSQILRSERGQILIPWRIKALGTSLGGTKDPALWHSLCPAHVRDALTLCW